MRARKGLVEIMLVNMTASCTCKACGARCSSDYCSSACKAIYKSKQCYECKVAVATKPHPLVPNAKACEACAQAAAS